MTQRGVSPVVGMALLLGLTAIVAVGILLVGASAVGSTADAAKEQQTTASMAEFATTTEQLTEGHSETGSFYIDGRQGATASVNESAGHVEATLYDDSGPPTTLVDQNLGTFQYRNGDDSTLVYQAGGVWRVEGDHAELVKPPNFDYRDDEQHPTLSFSTTRVTGNVSGSGDVSGTISVTEQNTVDEIENPVLGDYVHIDIQSEYCEGWQRHVEQRVGGTIEETCGDTAETVEGELRVNMSVGTIDGGEDESTHDIKGALVGHEVDLNELNEAADIYGDVICKDDTECPDESDPNLDDVLQGGSDLETDVDDFESVYPLEEQAQGLDDRVNGVSDSTYEDFEDSKTYDSADPIYIEEIDTTDGELTIDATNRDQTVVIKEDADFSSVPARINVQGSHDTTIWISGDMRIDGSPTDEWGNEDAPGNFTVVVGGEIHITGQISYHGVLIAPNGKVTVENDGTVLEGAAIGETVKVDGAEVRHDDTQYRHPESKDGDLVAEDLAYLHVSQSVVEVEG